MMTLTAGSGLDDARSSLLDHPEKPDQPKRRADKKEARGNSRIRKDIEGLRAVATFLVLPYHAGLMLFPGGFVGVDVFFVISGFVITGQLLKEVERSGRVSLMRFYARRAKRLLPASSVVLAATAVMTWLWVPKIRWETTGGDIVASALYFVNWRLADRSVDYLAEDVTPSAVQHYWSLAVEEQYYFIWPILLLLAVMAATKFGIRRKKALLGGLALVAVPSFLYAIYASSATPEPAYFATTTRMWEFTIGAFVAILAVHLDKMPRGLAIALAWGGLAMILVSGRVYHAEMIWPGAYAALPTIGTGLVIAAGVAAGNRGPVALIGNRFMLFIGYLTYSLYLWHWPLLIVAREHFAPEHRISVPWNLAIVVFTIVPAWLTFKLIENPIRNNSLVSRNSKVALSLGVNFTLAGVVAGLALVVALSQAVSPSVAPGSVPGAAALSDTPTRDQAGQPVDTVKGGITPDPLQAPKDVPSLYAEGCQVEVESSEPVTCTYGPADAKTEVAIVGDSKAAQWVPALEVLAKKNGWGVTTYTKSACQFAKITTSLDGEPYDTCRDWADNVIAELEQTNPDLVITAGQRDSGYDDSGELSEDAMQAAMVDTWTTLKQAGIKVAVLADTPQTGMDVYACVSEHPDAQTLCTYEREWGVARSGAEVQAAAAKEAKVPFLDLTDWICPTAECAPVIGNVLVYRQGSHITKTYIETLAPRLEQALTDAKVI
jgi:peptidoglycan/LPS O-acetylase OafA/YrhL